MFATEEAAHRNTIDPVKAEVEGRRVPVAKLTLREILVASERTSDGFDGRVANPEIIVDRRSRMNLAVVGEDEQIGPRDAKQVPEIFFVCVVFLADFFVRLHRAPSKQNS